jgi:MFS family permease
MLGVSEAQLGLVLFMTPISAVVAMLLAPGIGAALGRIALPVSAAAMALAFALPGQTTSVMLFPLAMLACGATTGLTDVLMNARVATLETERRLNLMNLCHAAYSFGYFGGAIVTGVMRGAAWSPAAMMASLGAVALLMTLPAIEKDGTIHGLRRPKGGTGSGLGILPLIGGAIVLIAFMTENAAENWSALHIEKSLGAPHGEGALGPAVLALTMGLARLAGQGLSARIPGAVLLGGGAAISAAGLLIAAAALSPAMAYAGFVVMGIGSSVIAPTAFSLVGRAAPDNARARAVARATLYGYFGYFFGPPLFGFIAGHAGLRMAFVLAACLLLAIPLLARRLAPSAQGN